VDRVFLDANVLFSAAYRTDSGLRRLWRRHETHLVTSSYALEEARRNLPESRVGDLARLVEAVELLAAVPSHPMPPEVASFPSKDQPILAAAVAARCTHLLTGDQTHFGPWFGKRLAGVMIMRPAEYLSSVSHG
jgi:predicted nucleic acid-binding protein